MKIPFLTATSEQSNSVQRHPVIDAIIHDAQEAEQERRSQGRMPFFQPVMISLPDEEPRAAFTRDISPNGIGLLHNFSFPPQIIEVALHLSNGKTVQMTIDTKWCVACGDGWYISGGNILESSDI